MKLEHMFQYNELYELYVNEMFAYGMAFGVEKETVLDAIHDVFLQVIERKDFLNIHSNVKYYFLSSLRNRLLSIKKKEILFESIDCMDEYSFSISVSGLDAIIEEEEEQKELTSQIEAMLNELTDKQREVIYLRYMQNLDYEEISRILQISSKSVRKLNYRALARMKENNSFVFLFFLLHFSLN